MLIAPTSYEENLQYRVNLINKAETDEKAREACRVAAKGDFEWFCNTFLWTYDSRDDNDPHKLFILWPKQKEFVDWLETLYQRSQHGEKINVLIDKPRGIGASYTLMAWVLWHYLFGDFTARIGSWKQDYVDKKGEPDSLFFKLDYMLERLPEWLVSKQHRSFLMMRPDESASGNSIIGESANPNFGRGGRKNTIIFDELGFWAWSKSSWESAGEATNFRIACSTPPPGGKDSHFYKLLTNQAGKVMVFNFDWKDDPRRNDDWLAEAKSTKSEEEFAREVLKSFEGTTEGKVYAISLRQAVKSDIDYNPELPLFVSWDFGLDEVAMIWWQKDWRTNKVRMIDCYNNSNKDIDFYIPFVTGIIPSRKPSQDDLEVYSYSDYELDIIERHKNWKGTITHFGDPDVAKRNLINKDSVKAHLRKEHGIYVQSKAWGGREWNDMKQITLLLFRRLEVNENRCEPVLSALRNAQYPKIREGSQRTNEPIKPVHDWTSHFRTSVEYFADNEPQNEHTKTIVGNVSQNASKPRIVTAEEYDKRSEEKTSSEIMRVRTVLSNLSKPSTGRNRVL